jgi:transcriptional regulator with XRE-family HTH domain
MDEQKLFAARNRMAGQLVAKRQKKGMTQEQLATATGMGIATVKRFESGRFWLSSKHLLTLCRALDCDLSITDE